MAINCNQLCYSAKKLIKQMNVLTVIGYIKTIMKNMTFIFKKVRPNEHITLRVPR